MWWSSLDVVTLQKWFLITITSWDPTRLRNQVWSVRWVLKYWTDQGPGIPDFSTLIIHLLWKKKLKKITQQNFQKLQFVSTPCIHLKNYSGIEINRKQNRKWYQKWPEVTENHFRFYPRMVNVTSNHRTNKKFIDSKILTVRDHQGSLTRFLSFNHHGTCHSILWPVIESKNLATWYKFWIS